ncbi:hypothetical protein KM176_07280 [Pseudooceanicola sp. CBS1P-1]|nr:MULTISPECIES: hypothetical protein [Pseudooceanicola]MBT9383654.1 hypothetical protein [Pseudooceanicola endophyticus]
MLRVLKWLLYLAILAGIALVAYAYVGPWLGVNFAPPAQEVHTPVTLKAE